jgi:hypothetical protein
MRLEVALELVAQRLAALQSPLPADFSTPLRRLATVELGLASVSQAEMPLLQCCRTTRISLLGLRKAPSPSPGRLAGAPATTRPG